MHVRTEAVNWLRSTFGASHATRQTASRRLYVSRTDATNRRVVNEPDLTAKLRALGFEIVVLGGLSFYEQIVLFSDAAVIVGPHGAGLANMAFAPSGAAIVELGAQNSRAFFSHLAEASGHSFQRITCSSAPTPEQRQSLNEDDFDMRVPIVVVVEAIRGLRR